MRDVLTWPVGRAPTSPAAEVPSPPVGPPAVYAVGATIAGTLTGLSISGVGAALKVDQSTALTAFVLAVAAIAATLQLTPATSAVLPPRHRQVPRGWLRWRSRSATAGAWGLLIGAGFWTSLRFSSLYVLAITLLFQPLWVGAGVGAIYGATRGIALLVTWFGDRTLGKRLSWESIASNQSVCLGLSLAAFATLGTLFASGTY